jgi:hypothetical protein
MQHTELPTAFFKVYYAYLKRGIIKCLIAKVYDIEFQQYLWKFCAIHGEQFVTFCTLRFIINQYGWKLELPHYFGTSIPQRIWRKTYRQMDGQTWPPQNIFLDFAKSTIPFTRLTILGQTFVVLSQHLPGVLGKIAKTYQDNWCPVRDSNQTPPEYESDALITDQFCSLVYKKGLHSIRVY